MPTSSAYLTLGTSFRYLDPSALADVVASQRIIDAMNCLDAPQWINAGWEYRGMGRSVTPRSAPATDRAQRASRLPLRIG